MNQSISPFDLPHVIEFIGLHLSKKDCANCTLVSKAFNRKFKPLLWRNITITNRKPSLYCKNAVAANGHLIRKLDVPDSSFRGTFEMIAALAFPCTNLCELNIFVSEHIQLGQVMDLVEKNPLLRSCHIVTSCLRDIKTLKRVIKVIRKHQALVHLTLKGQYSLGVISYRTLLQCLPSTLQSLELYWSINRQNKTIPYIQNAKWRGCYPNLRSISMPMDDEDDQKVTLPFLRRCPALENIKILERMSVGGQAKDNLIDLLGNAQLFPRLTDVSWNYGSLNESDWKSFILLMQGRIRSFSADLNDFDVEWNSTFARSLVPYWSNTLEVVRFQRQVDISSKDIQLMLTTCTNLKTFSVFATCHDESVVTNLSGLHVAELNPETSDSTDWVCLQLENLELAFTDFYPEEYDEWEDIDESSTLDNSDLSGEADENYLDYRPGCDDVKRIHKQLGRLTKLRFLRVGWIYPEYPDEPQIGIDFSLEDGLENLSGLKQLEVLDLSCLEQTAIDKAEIDWMNQNWPKLKWLKGIEEKEDLEFHGQMMVDFEKVTYPEASPAISPFDIPLIVDCIGRHLTKGDYANCILVSKSLIDRLALCQNGDLIRRLRISEDRKGSILRFLAEQPAPCKSLLEFECQTHTNVTMSSLFSFVLDVLEYNPGLRKFTMKNFISGATVASCNRFLRILRNHRSLRTLNLTDIQHMGIGLYRSLLQNIPVTLESLLINWSLQSRSEPVEFPEEGWRDTYPQLQSFSVRMRRGLEETALIPFLRRCPSLKRLESLHNWGQQLCKVGSFLWDPQFFCQLSEISLNSLILEESEWMLLISGMRGRIKVLAMDDVQIRVSLGNFFKAVTTHWVDTIEIISLESLRIPSQEIELILSTCSKLKSFAVTNDLLTRPRGLRAWNHEDYDDNKADWVCLQLERLELMVLDCRKPYGDDDDQMDYFEEELTINGVRRVYQQLGRLSKLRHLQTGWVSCEKFEMYSNFDLSLESGLGYLEGLKDLRVLDVHFERLKVGQMEIEWMVEN
ncbi:hypothetical protein BGX20_008195 [Mortierella sp. AD010]|nr:hypothetical protein BGX20_008195 [Mortierella sp. AD010]